MLNMLYMAILNNTCVYDTTTVDHCKDIIGNGRVPAGLQHKQPAVFL